MSHEVWVAYYQGEDGPTIRIDVGTQSGILELQRRFARLASQLGAEDDLCAPPAANADGLRGLVVRSVSRPPAAAIERLHGAGDASVFAWSGTTEDWEEWVEKIDALVEGGGPGHQYFTGGRTCEALVELCYRERG